MKYNYVLPSTKIMKVHYLQSLIDKLRMEERLKGISEEKSQTFHVSNLSKHVPDFFQVFKDFFKKKCFSRFSRVCGNPAT